MNAAFTWQLFYLLGAVTGKPVEQLQQSQAYDHQDSDVFEDRDQEEDAPPRVRD
jgi:hypothetical protein